MKAFVITIMDNEKSVQVADRCIRSGKNFGLDIHKFSAITPKSNIIQMMMDEGINPNGFEEVYSRTDNCKAAFLSHYLLWKKALISTEDILIFEHDAVIRSEIPSVPFNGCISYGKPSYGKFNTPSFLGTGPLTSKPYFPGAHAYKVSPAGASQLIEKAKTEAGPTDVFLRLDRFNWLQEYYPWPVEARDTFTTIQNERGCLAKHNYGVAYEII